jgi:hypothetical protein
MGAETWSVRPVNQEATPKSPGAFGRLRGWGRRLAAALAPRLVPPPAARAATGRLGELEKLLAESRAARGGEISARERARRIAAA